MKKNIVARAEAVSAMEREIEFSKGIEDVVGIRTSLPYSSFPASPTR